LKKERREGRGRSANDGGGKEDRLEMESRLPNEGERPNGHSNMRAKDKALTTDPANWGQAEKEKKKAHRQGGGGCRAWCRKGRKGGKERKKKAVPGKRGKRKREKMERNIWGTCRAEGGVETKVTRGKEGVPRGKGGNHAGKKRGRTEKLTEDCG